MNSFRCMNAVGIGGELQSPSALSRCETLQLSIEGEVFMVAYNKDLVRRPLKMMMPGLQVSHHS